jgi:sarcosine oxidase subunit alpha
VGSLSFEGREVPFDPDDTVASALYRDGLRTFSRSLKYHRRRGFYCGTGDCPNCLMTVDGKPAVHTCMAACADGMRVERAGGWPSAERDLLHVNDRLHRLMPVGFYYKTFIRPRFAWPIAERVIRRATGLGALPDTTAATRYVVRHAHVDTLVIGAGAAGLEAARGAASHGSVLVCDEGVIGHGVAPGPALTRVRELEAEVRAIGGVTVLEGSTALGVYEGLHVPIAGDGELVHAHPSKVVVATGATEAHGVFPGNDLPGVVLGRAAAALAGIHGVRPGYRAVVVVRTEEGLHHLQVLLDGGVEIAATAVSGALRDRLPDGAGEVVVDGEVHEALGGSSLRSVVLRREGRGKRFDCDLLVLSLGLWPRDGLARMALPGENVVMVGDAALEEVGERCGDDGIVCLCEDVAMHDLERAWDEGFRNAEILKRYTTTTMGPCQGAMCGRALSCFAASRTDASAGDPLRGTHVPGAARTTARPPARAVTLDPEAGCGRSPTVTGARSTGLCGSA